MSGYFAAVFSVSLVSDVGAVDLTAVPVADLNSDDYKFKVNCGVANDIPTDTWEKMYDPAAFSRGDSRGKLDHSTVLVVSGHVDTMRPNIMYLKDCRIVSGLD